MKKLIFLLIGLAVFLAFSSCKKEENPIPLNQEELLIERITDAQNIELLALDKVPQSIYSYVEDNHAPFGIEIVFYAPQLGYEVIMENGLCLFFNHNAHHLNHGGIHNDWDNHHNSGYHCLTGDTIPVDAVPQGVLDFIEENYPDNTIVTVVLKPSGKILIELDNGVLLFFSPYGVFIQECEFAHNQNSGTHHHHHFSFGDYSWHCEGDGMGGHGMGGHHGNGNNEGPCWGGTGIPIDNLPNAIIEYVNTNYPNATIKFAMQTYSNNYLLRLSDCIRILFDENGNVLFDSGN